MKDKVAFAHKARNIDEIYDVNVINKANESYFIIEKVITLQPDKWEYFKNHLLDDYTFITLNLELMYVDTFGVYHCIGVRTNDPSEGMIIGESEGCDYLRKSAFIEI